MPTPTAPAVVMVILELALVMLWEGVASKHGDRRRLQLGVVHQASAACQA